MNASTADQDPLPGSLVMRPYGGRADIETYVAIRNAELAEDGISTRATVGDTVADFAHPSDSFDPARDLTFAELDGRTVALAERQCVDVRDEPLREYRVGGAVLPDARRRGIGGALLAENERRSRELAAIHDTDRRRVFGAWTDEQQSGAIALLRRNGYREARWFFEMVRPTLDDVSLEPVPDGLVVRRGSRDAWRHTWDAIVEAFRDHWGGFDDSPASLERWKSSPHANPDLWLIAWDGEQIAGGVINTINAEENEALNQRRGWLNIVFTRRGWRRRGLARALLGRSFDVLREHGMTSAGLGVDADNPMGALGLYESAGFEVEHRAIAWRKAMDPQ